MARKQDVIIKVVTACDLFSSRSLLLVAIVGEWLSLVEHLVRDQGVGGSNPLSPTNLSLNSLQIRWVMRSYTNERPDLPDPLRQSRGSERISSKLRSYSEINSPETPRSPPATFVAGLRLRKVLQVQQRSL